MVPLMFPSSVPCLTAIHVMWRSLYRVPDSSVWPALVLKHKESSRFQVWFPSELPCLAKRTERDHSNGTADTCWSFHRLSLYRGQQKHLLAEDFQLATEAMSFADFRWGFAHMSVYRDIRGILVPSISLLVIFRFHCS